MLELARGAAPEVARRTGCANVSFRRGNIQDLRLDLDLLDEWLRDHPVGGASDLPALEEAARRLRRERPLVSDASTDLVISNCVLNLVRESDKPALLQEIFRVLKPGGRIALSDIVSDEVVPEDLKQDAELWSGCVSGAFQEGELLRGLASVGFYGVGIERWKEEPFRVVRGIEFRSVTVTARKGKEGPCFEGNQAVLYKGPWKQVEDDDHHVLRRGERTAVCDKTYRILTSEPYADQIIAIPSRIEIAAEDRKAFDCSRTAPRHPRETKGEAYTVTTEGDGACCPPGSCC
jgi:SAM-dependent methyltransferase